MDSIRKMMRKAGRGCFFVGGKLVGNIVLMNFLDDDI